VCAVINVRVQTTLVDIQFLARLYNILVVLLLHFAEFVYHILYGQLFAAVAVWLFLIAWLAINLA